MPWTLFICGNFCAKQGALHPWRLHVGASFSPYARFKTGANQIQPVHVLYKGTVCYLCQLCVYSRAARTPGKANHIHKAAQNVRRSSHPHLEFIWIRSKSSDESWRERARRVLGTLIVWEAEIVEKLQTNRAMNRLSARQQEEYDKATRCDISRHGFIEGEAKGPKVRDHDHITGWWIGAAHRQCNLERPVCYKI